MRRRCHIVDARVCRAEQQYATMPLIDQLGDIRSRQAIEALEPDDRARVLDELPTEVATRLIASLSPATRRETQAILGYDADMVGRLMTPDYVHVRPEWTVSRALDHIRKFGRDAETVHWIFVVDSKQRLVDDLMIRQLLIADPSTHISDLMDDSFQYLDAHEDREEAVRMMGRYDRTALPEDEHRVEQYGGKDFRIKTIGNKWSYLQASRFNRNAQPFYVMIDHDGNHIGGSAGYDPDAELFLEFLDEGLAEFNR